MSVRNVSNTDVLVSTKCLWRCYWCTCVVVPICNGNSESLISGNFDKQTTDNTLSFVLLSAFVLLGIQFSKSK